MSTSNNSINRTVGANTTNDLFTHLRASAGQWDRFNDQTDVHGYYSGVGSPEGVVAADIGSIYSDTGAGASGIYYKTTDTVSSGWTSIPSGAGPMVDYNYTNLTTQLTTSTIIPADNTIPQITEGVQYISLAYTPKSASNILFIEFSSYIAIQNAGVLNSTVAIFNGAANAIAAVNSLTLDTTAGATSVYVLGTQVAGTTSPITFSVRFGPNTANLVTMNGGIGGSSLYGGVGSGYFRITEYLPPGSASVAGAFSVVSQTFTANGTYTPTPGLQYCQVEMVGGGAAGGGSVLNGVGQFNIGAGGGGGEYAYGIFNAATIGVSQAVTIGAGGLGAAGAAGGNGGNTSLGALISAFGGLGGGVGVAAINTSSLGGVGGTGGAGGSVRYNGQTAPLSAASVTLGLQIKWAGANGSFGAGGGETVGTGAAATGFGAGGAGRGNTVVPGVATAGGAGSGGLIKITEYVIV